MNTLSSAMKSKHARKDYKEAQDTYWPAAHQEKIREKRKEFARIITTKSTTKQAKEDAQKSLKKLIMYLKENPMLEDHQQQQNKLIFKKNV